MTGTGILNFIFVMEGVRAEQETTVSDRNVNNRFLFATVPGQGQSVFTRSFPPRPLTLHYPTVNRTPVYPYLLNPHPYPLSRTDRVDGRRPGVSTSLHPGDLPTSPPSTSHRGEAYVQVGGTRTLS